MSDFKEDCERHIILNRHGAIEYQTILLKDQESNIDSLLTIVADHIIGRCSDDDDEGECINWPAVWADWEKNEH
jgi:hypothetical protein